MIGRNGVAGAAAALDGKTSITRAIVQVAGSASTMDADVLKGLAQQSETLRSRLFKNEQANTALAQQIAGCNAVHQLEARLARWLLQVRDLLHSDDLPLTQEFLA